MMEKDDDDWTIQIFQKKHFLCYYFTEGNHD
jgi:hypothetical protein